MNFKTLLEEKERDISVQGVIDDAQMNEKDIKSIVITYLGNDNEVTTVYSSSNFVELIGIMEWSKSLILNS